MATKTTRAGRRHWWGSDVGHCLQLIVRTVQSVDTTIAACVLGVRIVDTTKAACIRCFSIFVLNYYFFGLGLDKSFFFRNDVFNN